MGLTRIYGRIYTEGMTRTEHRSVGLLDIEVGMIDRTYGEIVAYKRIADHATITFADGSVKRVGWGFRIYPIGL